MGARISADLLRMEEARFPTAKSLQDIYGRMAAEFWKLLDFDRKFDGLATSLPEPEFLEDKDSNFRLTRGIAELICTRIRNSGVIPSFVPAGAVEHYDFDRWHKAFWYVPASLCANRRLSPLVLEQMGLWALLDSDDEFSLVANFDEYYGSSLVPLSPTEAGENVDLVVHGDGVTPVDSEPAGNWWTLFLLRESKKARDGFFIAAEHMPDDDLGHHLLVVKAIIDAWFPYVEKHRGQPFFSFPDELIVGFDDFQSLLDWALEDKDAAAAFAATKRAQPRITASANNRPSAADRARALHEGSAGAGDVSAGGSSGGARAEQKLIRDPQFLELVEVAKGLAAAADKTELNPLLFLCAVRVAGAQVAELDSDARRKVDAAARRHGIVLIKPRRLTEGSKLPLRKDFRDQLAQHSGSSVARFISALVATLPDVVESPGPTPAPSSARAEGPSGSRPREETATHGTSQGRPPPRSRPRLVINNAAAAAWLNRQKWRKPLLWVLALVALYAFVGGNPGEPSIAEKPQQRAIHAILDHAWPLDGPAVAQDVSKVRQMPATQPVPGEFRLRARQANTAGLAALRRNDLGGAVAKFREGAEANPADEELANNLGYALLLNGDLRSAEDALQDSLRVNPERATAWVNYGDVLAKLGQRDRALGAYMLAYHFAPNPKVMRRSYLEQSRQHQDPVVRGLLVEVLAALPEN